MSCEGENGKWRNPEPRRKRTLEPASRAKGTAPEASKNQANYRGSKQAEKDAKSTPPSLPLYSPPLTPKGHENRHRSKGEGGRGGGGGALWQRARHPQSPFSIETKRTRNGAEQREGLDIHFIVTYEKDTLLSLTTPINSYLYTWPAPPQTGWRRGTLSFTKEGHESEFCLWLLLHGYFSAIFFVIFPGFIFSRCVSHGGTGDRIPFSHLLILARKVSLCWSIWIALLEEDLVSLERLYHAVYSLSF